MVSTEIYTFKDDPEKALELYFDRGYHVEPNVFSSEECDALINAAQNLQAAQEHNYRPAMMPHKENNFFLKGLRHKAIAEIIYELVGGKASGLQTEFFYCKPGTRGFSLHQDNFFVDAPIGAFASAWTALTDITPNKGGLIVYPGAHKEGLLPVEKLSLSQESGQDPNANNEQCIIPAKYNALNISVSKGSTVFIHGHIPHASNNNDSNKWRYVLLCTYIRSGERFRPGNYAQREEVALVD